MPLGHSAAVSSYKVMLFVVMNMDLDNDAITIDVGLPWQKWTSLIVLAINLLWFLLFLPETRFHRDTSAAAVVGRNVASNAEDSPAETLGEQRKEKLDSEQAISRENSIRRTRFQERSLWSGVNTETSYLSLLLRPLPLIIYPACTFAVLACESPSLSQN